MSAPPLRLVFVQSATDVAQLPDRGPEVAVVGRSNVGKSSLVNALAARTNLAHVSKTPGRTQLINQFAVDGRPGAPPTGALVDLPGYGYAAAPGRVKRGWERMIEGYLLDREQLQMVLVLVDGEVGPTRLDLQMLEWLRHHGVPHTVAATKQDKVRSTLRPRRKRELAVACGLEAGDVVGVSVHTGAGVEQLRSLVRAWLTVGT